MTLSHLSWANPLLARKTGTDLSVPDPKAKYWDSVPQEHVPLMAQPMAIPRPEVTRTAQVAVQALHDGKRLALRLRWRDADRNEAGRLGEFSDAAAVQFPLAGKPVPPPVMMGMKGDPVHIFHWRAQYQRDAERGKPGMKDLYPNQAIDMYPMEFADPGTTSTDEAARDKFSPGREVGNPQSYPKNGVDEIFAEGFSTSAVQEGHQSQAKGNWENGEWTLVIVRPLAIEGGSTVKVGSSTWVGFAVWQGGLGEVGSRKCVTMTWTAFELSDKS
ncbi:MAG: hypothetical protein IPJ65_14570 [Archangiaceae bacterium]|nr:hypothetical protein [Archangiaceae bacterium]